MATATMGKDTQDIPQGQSLLDQAQCEAMEEVHINELPDELLEFILTYLPPYKDLEHCSLVCKRWGGIVNGYIRRAKMGLQHGLNDFRLRWEVFSEQTADSIREAAGEKTLDSRSKNFPVSIIAGRFSHSAVCYKNHMYVFGGGSSSDTTFNDLWRFDLSGMCWERPLSLGAYPSPKGSASMVCWGEYLILFGGWRYPSLHPPYQPWLLFDELHYYHIPEKRWSVKTSLEFPGPPPMAGHSASVHGDRMVVFGGYQVLGSANSNTNDTWCLDLPENRWYQPRIANNIKPPPRYGQTQLELDDKHLLIIGGCGGPNSIYSDAWVLDMTKDVWAWRSVQVRNKKYSAAHMWCNPACKVDSKLVVLGPTPNMPQDFQMIKQTRVPVGGGMPAPRLGALQQNRNNLNEDNHPAGNGGARNRVRIDGGARAQDEVYYVSRRPIFNRQQQQNNNMHFLNNNNLQPRTGNLNNLHDAGSNKRTTEERNHNRPTTSSAAAQAAAAIRKNGANAPAIRNDNEPANGEAPNAISNNSHSNAIEAAHRLQRNLALRARDNDPLLPKRFDELYEDPFRMAAFHVHAGPRNLSKDHSERIRRMEEKMNALRNSRRTAPPTEQKSTQEPSPKRAKRNVLSLFVCDLSAALDPVDPHLKWLEYKNYGILPGAPERLILSTMVAGHGELILFGGVQKETLTEIVHQVSNTIHFLSAPRDIV